MVNQRYIFRYTGDDISQQAQKEAGNIRSTSGVKVVDDSMAPKVLLVEAPESAIQQLRGRLSGWVISPEVNYDLPDTQKRVL